MSLITTNDGRIVLKKAESMMVVPYVYDSSVGDYVIGEDVYDISAVIGDSITLEQDDGERKTKNNEFVAAPLIESVSGAKYNFTAQCIDLQNAVLVSCFNVMSVDGVSGAIAFNDDHTLLYALVRVRFKDESLPDVFIPKLQLNSKLLVNQLKTRLSQGNISGSAQSVFVAVAGSGNTSALQFDVPTTGGTTYTPFTPVLFVPRGNEPLFFHHKGNGSTDYYSYVDFSNGSSSVASVDSSDGSIDLGEGGGNSGGSSTGGNVGNEE